MNAQTKVMLAGIGLVEQAMPKPDFLKIASDAIREVSAELQSLEAKPLRCLPVREVPRLQGLENAIVAAKPDCFEAAELLAALIASVEDRYHDLRVDREYQALANELNEYAEKVERVPERASLDEYADDPKRGQAEYIKRSIR